jgi:hypothetical protein
MWTLITQAIPCHTTYHLYNYHSQGILVGEYLTIIISILNYMIIWNTGTHLNLTKEELGVILDILLKENFISTIFNNLQEYIHLISLKAINQLLNILSELVLTSNQFLSQVIKILLFLMETN